MIDLAAIRQRAEAASAGPWKADPDTGAGRVWVQRQPGARMAHLRDCEPLFSVRGDDAYRQREADAVFIAHAREDVPALVAEIERLRALVDRNQSFIGRWRRGVA